jgi:hypothetical protein
MIYRATLLVGAALTTLVLAAPAIAVAAEEPPCELNPQTRCFGVESLDASLTTTQAGAHPDLTFTFDIRRDPESEPNVFGLKDAYAPSRNVRIELPPGLIGDPNAFGVPQQCTSQELIDLSDGCPNGSQVGVTKIFAYQLTNTFIEPVYMMQPPGEDVVARVGFVAATFPTFVDFRVRSDNDYGIDAEIVDSPSLVDLVKATTTTWGVPADDSHDTERCTPGEVLNSGCVISESRPPGSRRLPFITNPTRCGVPLEMGVSASSWSEPDVFDTASTPFPVISGCDGLPFGPSLVVEPTTRRAASPTGLEMTIRLPASEGEEVLEPSQIRDIRIDLPEGLTVNPGSADGLGTCSPAQVRFGTREPSACPDAAKLAATEFEIPALPRRMKGAIYLREPEPGNLFRVWVVADDLGAHVKLAGQLEVDEETGQISSVVVDLPQVPMRETRLLFKSGFRAPLATPPSCDANPSTPERDAYRTSYEFVPWAGGPSVAGSTPMRIDEGCEGLGGFAPELSAGTSDPVGGKHSPFLFTLRRSDGEQSPGSLDIELPPGLTAKLAGVARCVGAAAARGPGPPAARIGRVVAATGYGPAPLWVPQPGKRPTAVYLAGPYKGAPLSVVAVVPAQAGPFDLGDVVVRSAIAIDPETAEPTISSDPLPQIIEGIPIAYRAIHVDLDRPGFALNPTNCKRMAVGATVTSTQGAVARPSSPFTAVNCANLRFRPRLGLRLFGGTRRGAHPKLRTVLRPRKGHANIGRLVLTLPRSEFLDQGHIRTVCTRVQFAADACPRGSIYGRARAFTPLLDEPLEGPVYLRSSSHLLPDVVVALAGEVDVHAVGRIDSVRGGIRVTFPSIPDAPISKVVVNMRGGNKGLLINSRNLCKGRRARASAKLRGQNGRRRNLRPKLRSSCRSKGKRRKRARRSNRAAR